MPYYEVHHSYPLEHKQKAELAAAITNLHSRTFTTPSIFVHVRFAACDASARNYFLAGEPKDDSTNRIIGMVRTSEQRTKEIFDKLAEKIEDAWYDAVSGPKIEEGKDEGKRKAEAEDTETEKDRNAKRLGLVVFYPMIAIRELGMVMPKAGEEGKWYKDNLSHFKEQAEVKGDENFVRMLQEMEERDDLKKLIS